MFGNCPVTEIWRVTAIYRAVIYRFDCINRIGVNCNHYFGNSLQRTDDSADEVTYVSVLKYMNEFNVLFS